MPTRSGACAARRDRERVGLVYRGACVQGSQASEREVGVERRAGHAEAVRPPSELLGHSGVLRDHGTPTTSECPFRNLVVEWTTRWAPRSNGRWLAGDRRVLSTTQSAPTSRATRAHAPMSATRRSGLLGLSSQMIRGLLCRASSNARFRGLVHEERLEAYPATLGQE